ncbi:MAG: hypothetical protein HGA19_11525 [Oscillochloris sp.]|nr:hypothetical protein [Oscillochloris sp.]
MEGRGGDIHALTSEIRSLVQESLQQALANAGIGARFVSAVPTLPEKEQIPPAPPTEPALDAGPIATWTDLTGRSATPADVAKIKEAVRRFERASQGYAAYWLTRAFTCVALEEQAPLTITYASGILRRMQEQGDWSTEELHRRAKEQRSAVAETAASPPAAPAPKAARVPRGKATATGTPRTPAAAALAATQDAPAAPALPPAAETHWAITAWRSFAGPSAAITATRARQLNERVTDRPAWEAVLTNWRAQYHDKANWSHFDGLLERYDREVTAGKPVRAAVAGDAPPIPKAVIYHHPNLDQEQRRVWTNRYNDAGSKPAQQAVLRRLLAEHPLAPDDLAALIAPSPTAA